MKKHSNYPSLVIRDEDENDLLTSQQSKNMLLIKLIEEWIADESGYDEEVWPIVKKGIEENRLSYRRRFND